MKAVVQIPFRLFEPVARLKRDHISVIFTRKRNKYRMITGVWSDKLMFNSPSSYEVSDTNAKYFISANHFNFKTINPTNTAIIQLEYVNRLLGCGVAEVG